MQLGKDRTDKVKIKVVYQDEWLLIADKPAGLLTIPDWKGKARTLTEILNQDFKKNKISCRLHPCHRLDRATSGLIIYAKGKSAQKKVMQQFKERRVKKTYLAFVQGNLKEPRAKIENKIDGQFALTRYRVIEQRGNFTIVEVMPLTGRKNQIRIHFRQINHPLVGEDKFSFRRDYKLRCKRLCLHAKGLEFNHPITGQRLSFSSELPKQLDDFLNQNR